MTFDQNCPAEVEALVRELEKRGFRRRRPSCLRLALEPLRSLGPWARGFLVGLLVGLIVGAALPRKAEASDLGVTAYCDAGVMADGYWTHRGAAASNYYPFGELLWVNGYGPVVVEDRSAPGATYVDIYMPSCDSAWQWGREYVPVYDEGNIYAQE